MYKRQTLYFLCNPHNPTGRVWSKEELRRIGEICFANNVFVVSDEIHFDFIRAGVEHTVFATLFLSLIHIWIWSGCTLSSARTRPGPWPPAAACCTRPI